MKRFALKCVPLLLVAALPLQAAEALTGTSTLTLGIGANFDTRVVTFTPRLAGGVTVYDFSEELSLGGGTGLAITGTVLDDDSLTYAIDALNFTTLPLAFSLAFNLPVPTLAYQDITISFASQITDLDGNGGGISFLSGGPQLDFQPVAPLAFGYDNCEAAGPAGSTTLCPGFGPAGTSLAASYGVLSTNLDFVLSRRDPGRFTGSTSLTPASTLVPEPAGWALLLSGFGILGASLRASRRERSPALRACR